jgi:hypothetical protein
MKNLNYAIGNRTRDLTACSAVPQRSTCNFEMYDVFVIYKGMKCDYRDGEHRCDVLSSVGKLPMFWRNLLPPSLSLKMEAA